MNETLSRSTYITCTLQQAHIVMVKKVNASVVEAIKLLSMTQMAMNWTVRLGDDQSRLVWLT